MMKNILVLVLFPFFFLSQSLDYRVLKSLNGSDRPKWDKFNEHVSFSVYPVMPSVIGGIFIHGYITENKDLMRSGFKSAISIGIASAAATSVKYLMHRPRPFKAYPNDIIKRGADVGPLSFPSGHTTVAFASATALTLSYKEWYVALPSYLYAGMVGYSRMRLGVHYPSDVLAGMIIGIGAGVLTWHLDKKINNK
jgi:membrane-associated phospholipid phosphatase